MGKTTFLNRSDQVMVGLDGDGQAQVNILEYLPAEDREWFQEDVFPSLEAVIFVQPIDGRNSCLLS